MSVFYFRLLSIGTIFLAISYQYYLKDFLFSSLGLFRTLQPLSDFPYTCRPLRHEYLEGCEDIWLDEEGRALYAGCASLEFRTQWAPAMDRLDISSRGLTGSHVSVLELDSVVGDEFKLRRLEPKGYAEPAGGDTILAIFGFKGEIVGASKLRFWMVNHRYPVEATRDGETLLDPYQVGANSTVEVFDVDRGRSEMVHVKTFSSGVIETPNNLVLTGDGEFFVTNDHSAKVGLRRHLDPFIGGGSIGYCNASSCHLASSSGWNYANGIVRGHDGLYYIASSFRDNIRVMQLQDGLTMKEMHIIKLGMPVDNLSIDGNGDIYAAGFPKILKVLEAFKKPYETRSPSTIWRIRRVGLGLDYEVRRILEDKEATIVRGLTVAVHDVKTGRLFLGGVVAPWITVCEPH